MNVETQTARNRLQLIEVLLVVLLLAAGMAGYFTLLARICACYGVLAFVAALLFRNKIEDWFLDLRDRI